MHPHTQSTKNHDYTSDYLHDGTTSLATPDRVIRPLLQRNSNSLGVPTARWPRPHKPYHCRALTQTGHAYRMALDPGVISDKYGHATNKPNSVHKHYLSEYLWHSLACPLSTRFESPHTTHQSHPTSAVVQNDGNIHAQVDRAPATVAAHLASYCAHL